MRLFRVIGVLCCFLVACGDDDGTGDNNNVNDNVNDNTNDNTNGNTNACVGTAPAADLNVGVCAGALKVCVPETGWEEPDYTTLTGYEVVETSCDNADNDCDGETDEGLLSTFYEDADGDTYGTADATVLACTAPTGYTVDSQDCDDASDLVNPAATEVCDGVDNDCDGTTDAGPCDAHGHCEESGGTVQCVCDPRYYGNGTVCDPTIALAAGYRFACGIKGGELFCWGKNDFGQLGLGTTDGTHVPNQVDQNTDWDAISGGWNHACGVRSGELYCWGENETADGTNIKLGLGPAGFAVVNVLSATRVGTASDWESVSCGHNHTCGIAGGALYCWGSNSYGQLGIGTLEDQSTPQVLMSGATGWEAVDAASRAFTCGINSGQMYCWGQNNRGQLGTGDATDHDTPALVDTDTTWTHVATEGRSACGIKAGELYCWGRNAYGQLGTGDTTDYDTPQRVGSGSDWLTVSGDMGGASTCGVRSSSGLYCWGAEWGDGTLGLGDDLSLYSSCTTDQSCGFGYDCCTLPEQVDPQVGWSVYVGGWYNRYGLLDGDLYCWGANFNGALTLDETVVSATSIPVMSTLF